MKYALLVCVACFAGNVDAQTNLLTPNSQSAVADSGGNTRAIASGDYDGDGDQDLYLSNFGEDNMLFVNHGNGTFEPLAAEVAMTDGGFTFHSAWGDMDGDGDLDLATANGHVVNNGLFKNLRPFGAVLTPQFQKMNSSVVCNDAGESYAVTWGDMDNDGDQDLLFANQLEPTFYYDNQGAGNFAKVSSGPVVTDNRPSRDICVGDLDGDGDLEIALANSNDLENFVYFNQGGLQGGSTGAFLPMTADIVATETNKTFGVSMADFDGDGDLDFFCCNRKGQLNTLYSNDGSGSFTLASAQAPAQDGGDSYHAAWGDLEGDGDLDLFVANKEEDNFLYMNMGGSLQRVASSPAITDAGDSRHAVFTDVNLDGVMSLVVANTSGENNLVYDNTASPWDNLGLAYQPVPNAAEPRLSGAGTMKVATLVTLFAQDFPANSVVTVVAGLSRVDMPFRGGVLVPAPDVLVPGFASDSDGEFEVSFTLPHNVPVGTKLYFQGWVPEALSPTGLVSTNGLEATSSN
ncbi:MAG: hypothetical protein ACI9EF_002864 [Pseudohongiellaceae bacterium]|jgi:hypothetical protein